MVCLGIEPGAAGWKARTNPLSYGGTHSVTRLGDLLSLGKLFKATKNLHKSPTFLGNFCRGVKIFNFLSEIIFGQLL